MYLVNNQADLYKQDQAYFDKLSKSSKLFALEDIAEALQLAVLSRDSLAIDKYSNQAKECIKSIQGIN